MPLPPVPRYYLLMSTSPRTIQTVPVPPEAQASGSGVDQGSTGPLDFSTIAGHVKHKVEDVASWYLHSALGHALTQGPPVEEGAANVEALKKVAAGEHPLVVGAEEGLTPGPDPNAPWNKPFAQFRQGLENMADDMGRFADTHADQLTPAARALLHANAFAMRQVPVGSNAQESLTLLPGSKLDFSSIEGHQEVEVPKPSPEELEDLRKQTGLPLTDEAAARRIRERTEEKVRNPVTLKTPEGSFKVEKGTPLYHTTSDENLTKFNPDKITWFTPSKEQARGYRENAGGKTLTAEFQGGKIATQKEWGPIAKEIFKTDPIYSMFDENVNEFEKKDVRRFIQRLKDEGYDGATITDYSSLDSVNDSETIALFNPDRSTKLQPEGKEAGPLPKKAELDAMRKDTGLPLSDEAAAKRIRERTTIPLTAGHNLRDNAIDVGSKESVVKAPTKQELENQIEAQQEIQRNNPPSSKKWQAASKRMGELVEQLTGKPPKDAWGRGAKPTLEATVAAGGTGAASSEELARAEVFVKYNRSGQPTYLGKSPDAALKPGEAVLAVNPKTGKVRTQNTNGLTDGEAIGKFASHARKAFGPKPSSAQLKLAGKKPIEDR